MVGESLGRVCWKDPPVQHGLGDPLPGVSEKGDWKKVWDSQMINQFHPAPPKPLLIHQMFTVACTRLG